MTDANGQTARPPLEPLKRARLALGVVDQLGELDEIARLEWAASGTSPGKAQQQFLLHAATLALYSIAESLERIAKMADPITDKRDLPELISRPQAAKYLGVTPQALSQLNTRGQGPRYIRVGRSVRYRRDDLLAWLAEK